MQNGKSLKIGIDARFYGPLGKGLGRYIKEIVDGVTETDQTNNYVIFLGKENFDEFKTNNPRVKKVLTDVRWYGLAEQILMPFYIWKEGVDLMHFPHFNVPILHFKKFVVTIHDLILTKHATKRASKLSPFLYYLKNIAYKVVIKSAVWRAEKVIAISRYTQDDIIKQFKIPKSKTAMTYEGVSKCFQSSNNLDDKEVLLRYNINSPFLLYVGNAYPHKNLEGLVRIFSNLQEKNKDLMLVLVGKDDYFYLRVKKYAEDLGLKKIIFPGFVPDEELLSFYKRAKAYVFPSLFEGFGLPPLEAMNNNCPVLSSNKTCMPEILGDAAFYFDPEKEGEATKEINKTLNNDQYLESLKEKGFKQVKKYSWEKCVIDTLTIYKNAIKKDPSL